MLTMLAGCTGAGPQTPSLVANGIQRVVGEVRLPKPDGSVIALTTRDHFVPKAHAGGGKSWMDPDAKNTQYLLYVSDQPEGMVNVYAYRSRGGHLMGQLAGFDFPYGECLDTSGNVYVADFASADIVEYAHGGKDPIKTLSDSYGYPIGCSVDPKTGNLAVANFEGLGSTCMGGIVIYQNASGSGTLYQDKDFNYYWPPGYDSQGNLFVEGRKKEKNKGKTGIAEIAAGGQKLVTLPLTGGKIEFPGGMQWDGHYITATDQAYQGGHLSGIYRLAVTSSNAKVVDSSELSDQCLKEKVPYNDVVQPWLNGTAPPHNTVVAGNLSCTYRFNFWNYLKGGNPKRSLPYDRSPELAYGQTVSPMKR
jgi:hypothetical protein